MADFEVSTMTDSVHATEAAAAVSEKKSSLPWYRRLDQTKGILLLLICMAQMLDIINVASVTIALPSILRDVGYQPNQLQWIVSSYALTYSAFLLVGGRMGDLFGHRRIFLLGTTWFAVWSLVCGFARNPIFMSVSRGLQGAGAGFTIPSALALLTTTYPLGPERTFALSMFGGAACIGQTVGVLLGGIFDATIGWYWIFYVTAIISATLAVSGFFVISKSQHNHPVPADRRIDYGGVALFMIGIIAVVYYLSESTTAGWGSAKTLPAFIAGLALLAVFVFWELRVVTEYPIMPFHIWKSRRFASSVAIIVCVTATYNTMIFYTSLTFQNVMKYSPLITACCYIVHGCGLVLGLYTVTRLFVVIRTKFIILIGWCLIAVSAILFSRMQSQFSYFHWAFPAFIVNCLGLSPTWMSCQVNAVADAKDEDQGVVGAIFNVAMQLGGPIGLALSTIMANAHTAPEATGDGLMSGYAAAFYTMAVIAGVGMVISVVLASNRDPPEFSAQASSKTVEMDEEKNVGGDKEEVSDEVGEQGQSGPADSTLSVAPTIVEETEKSSR
ncbi:hypothetical protein EMPS_04352 [Entomortierella parvispora]|uniref:Major facilitator superfamily (MFS) profile domain-containing protein n=1 Tax=Entomortierella parvispora TaxID=205924 RepID=A0A9P3LVQ8_9FUNG|nr:hypothetical protein EMPS_04352 [Entomortierella parvispora]